MSAPAAKPVVLSDLKTIPIIFLIQLDPEDFLNGSFSPGIFFLVSFLAVNNFLKILGKTPLVSSIIVGTLVTRV